MEEIDVQKKHELVPLHEDFDKDERDAKEELIEILRRRPQESAFKKLREEKETSIDDEKRTYRLV
jgi:hypothetical protein